MKKQIEWSEPSLLQWCQYLLDSYVYWLNHDLILRKGSQYEQAELLFNSAFVVVSHGTQNDPILNYGNRVALSLWEMTLQQFTQTPSRLTAEPVNREERARMLSQAREHGYISDYCGVRISHSGKRFYVDQAVIWNVFKPDGTMLGQAAKFSKWRFL